MGAEGIRDFSGIEDSAYAELRERAEAAERALAEVEQALADSAELRLAAEVELEQLRQQRKVELEQLRQQRVASQKAKAELGQPQQSPLTTQQSGLLSRHSDAQAGVYCDSKAVQTTAQDESHVQQGEDLSAKRSSTWRLPRGERPSPRGVREHTPSPRGERQPQGVSRSADTESQTDLKGAAMENLVSDEEAKRLKVVVQELQAKMNEMVRKCKSRVGVSTVIDDIISEVGLKPVLNRHCVFDKLYKDALDRIGRLERLRQRYQQEREGIFHDVVRECRSRVSSIDVDMVLAESRSVHFSPLDADSPTARSPSVDKRVFVREGAVAQEYVETGAGREEAPHGFVLAKKEEQKQMPVRVQAASGLLPPHLVQASQPSLQTRRSLAQVTLELPSEPQRKSLSKAVSLPFLGAPLTGEISRGTCIGGAFPAALSPASQAANATMASAEMRSSTGMPVSLRRSKSRHMILE